MKPLKVLHLSSERTWRGGEQQIAYLIEESLNDGLAVGVAVRRGSAFQTWCEERNVPVFPMGFGSGFAFRSAWKIVKIAKDQSFDLVHVHSGKALTVAYLAANLGLKCPVVVHRRVDFPVGRNWFSLKKYNHPSVAGIICVSKAIALLVREVVKNPKLVHTIYDGIGFSRFNLTPRTGFLHKEFGIAPQKMLVANVSAVAPHKDYPTFIRTAALLLEKRNDVHFLVVGEGDLLADMKLLARQLDIDQHITFTGFRTDVPAILRELDIFLMTSTTEGLGTTIIDAMYNGIPVVATRAGGIPELVLHGETGLLCDVQEVHCLASAVGTLLDNRQLAGTYGDAGHKRALSFSKEAMARDVIDFYRKVRSR